MRKLFLSALALSALSSLSGCGTTGVVDYRRAATMTNQEATALRATHLENCWPQSERAGDEKDCRFMLPTSLSDKNFGQPSDAININDVYSIKLDFGRLAAIGSSFSLERKGEIAILVNAFEFAAQGSNASDRPRFYNLGQGTQNQADGTYSPDYANARVVYFSPEVRSGQALNLSNIPITAPQKYQGRPIGVQIIVIELDRTSDATKSLLKGLAELGRTTVGSGPATDTLLNLGKSFLDGAHDDVIFEYRFSLENAANLGNQVASPFTSGRYVFRRVEPAKRISLIWQNLRLDQNTGELLLQPEAGKVQARPYLEETYFTINVINHGPNGVVDSYENATWNETSQRFNSFLNASNPANLAATNVQEQVNDLLATRRSLDQLSVISAQASETINAWSALRTISASINTNVVASTLPGFADESFGGPTCTQNLALKRAQSLIATEDARSKTSQLIVGWRASKDNMKDADKSVALERLRTGANNLLGPAPTNSSAFITSSAFEIAYVAPANGEELLSAHFEARLQERRPQLTCANLAR
jgi:hypothetical protein